jgi:hypothetical protein
MKTSNDLLKGKQLKKGMTSSLSSSHTSSEHQITLWQSYKDRLEGNAILDKKSGEIWSTIARPLFPQGVRAKSNSPVLVLILDPDGEVLFYKGVDYHKILVAPISTYVEMATQWDFVVKGDESPLGYPFMIEMWNKVTMLAENLGHGLASLDDRFRDHVLRLSMAQTANLVDESPLDSELFKNNIGDGMVEMGSRIYHFQRKEIEDAEYLIQPLKALTEAIVELTTEEQSRIFESLKNNLSKSSPPPPVDSRPITQKDKKIQSNYQQLMAGVPNE